MSKSIVLALAVLFGAASALLAEDGFETLLGKLVDDRYEVRAQAKKELLIMCREKPELTDRLAPIIFDEEEEAERVHSAWEVVADVIFVERGAIGITLNQQLVVERMVHDGPAMKSGIQVGLQLVSIAGIEAKGKTPSEVYSYLHTTRPGEKIEMSFVDKNGEKMVFYPIVAPRKTIRSDENSEQRKQQVYEEWLEKQRKRLQLDAD